MVEKLEERMVLMCSGNYRYLDNTCVYENYKVRCTYEEYCTCTKNNGNPDVEILIYNKK